MDASFFLHHCRARLPDCTLSLGWTTSKAVWPWDAAYTCGQTEAMRRLCVSHGLRNVTLAVSAFHASLRPEPLLRLLADQPSFSLTFWGEAPPWVSEAAFSPRPLPPLPHTPPHTHFVQVRRWIDRVAAEVGEERVYVDIKPCPLGLALWHGVLTVWQLLATALAAWPSFTPINWHA
jgi:hypothetical protein